MGKAFQDWQFSPFFPIKKKLRKTFSRKSAQGWGKMWKNGERILWGKHFSSFFPIKKKTSKDVQQKIGTRMGKNGEKWGKNFMGKAFFPIFPIKKKLRKTFSRKSAQGWGKMGKNGEKWGKNFMGKAFYDWQFSPFFPIIPHWLPPNMKYDDLL